MRGPLHPMNQLRSQGLFWLATLTAAVVLPSLAQAQEMANTEGVWLERHDLLTGEVRRWPLDAIPLISSSDGVVSEPFIPPNADIEVAEATERGFGNMVGVPNSTAYPYSTVSKLFIQMSNFGEIGCSGALVGDRWIATSGSCIADLGLGQLSFFPPSYVVPGYAFGNEPYGAIAITAWWALSSWVYNQLLTDNVGILELALPVGNTAGYMGVAYGSTPGFFGAVSPTKYSVGYPSTDENLNPVFDNGQRQYERGGYTDQTPPGCSNCRCHNQPNYRGMAGGPVYYISGNNRWVAGVNTTGSATHTCLIQFSQQWASTVAAIMNGTIGNGVIIGLEEFGQATFSIAPNPADDGATVIADEALSSLELCDATGRVLYTDLRPSDRSHISTRTLADGVYMVRARASGTTRIQRLLVQH